MSYLVHVATQTETQLAFCLRAQNCSLETTRCSLMSEDAFDSTQRRRKSEALAAKRMAVKTLIFMLKKISRPLKALFTGQKTCLKMFIFKVEWSSYIF